MKILIDASRENHSAKVCSVMVDHIRLSSMEFVQKFEVSYCMPGFGAI